MIERFNFYDIYGYFFPGFVLAVLLWAPFAVVDGAKPPSELASALILASLCYVLGHLVQAVALDAFPSTFGTGRFPSDLLLDPENRKLSKRLRELLFARVKATFDIDLATQSDSALRRDVFFLCRRALANGKTYAEQFEGMYALMRGLCATFGLGAFSLLGWCVAATLPSTIRDAALATATVTAIICAILQAQRDEKKSSLAIAIYACLALSVFLTSALAASSRPVANLRPAFALSACVALLFAVLCHFAYRYFAWHFAQSIYRDFVSLPVAPLNRPLRY